MSAGTGFKVLVECVDGPMDGHSCMVEETAEALGDRVFLFGRILDGVKVVDAYAWTGRHSTKGLAMLGHLMEVGRCAGAPAQTQDCKTQDAREEEEA